MASFARNSGAPVDVSSSLAVWGHHLRGADLPFIGIVGREVSQAADAGSAATLLQASLLGLLSAIGKDCLTFCFLPVSKALEEHQMAGALEAMDQARQEGLIQFMGLHAPKSPWAAQSAWQFHDAFEVILAPQSASGQAEKTLRPTAESRRVGFILGSPMSLGQSASMGHHPSVQKAAMPHDPHLALLAASASRGPALLGVRSVKEMEAALTWRDHASTSNEALAAARLVLKETA